MTRELSAQELPAQVAFSIMIGSILLVCGVSIPVSLLVGSALLFLIAI